MSKKWLIVLIVLLALIFLGPVPLVKTPSGYIINVIVNLSMIFLMFSYVWTASKLRRRFAGNTKASTDELRREDGVLLQGTALSQSVFFIYLNLIPSSHIVEIFKWTVPIVAISFYIIRAYAKIRDSPKYRYYSILVLVMIMIQIVVYAIMLITPTFYVDGHDVLKFYISSMAGGFFVLFLLGISNALKRRYGYI